MLSNITVTLRWPESTTQKHYNGKDHGLNKSMYNEEALSIGIRL